jgi:hypothetical protein
MFVRRGIGAAVLMNDDRLNWLRSIRDPAGELRVLKTIFLSRWHDEIEQQAVSSVESADQKKG